MANKNNALSCLVCPAFETKWNSSEASNLAGKHSWSYFFVFYIVTYWMIVKLHTKPFFQKAMNFLLQSEILFSKLQAITSIC